MKIYKKILFNFFHQNFLCQNDFLLVFPLSEFSSSQPFSTEFIISESEEISEISVS